MKTDTDDLLGPMRSAWKAGIERDERDEHAASARRLARAVTPREEPSASYVLPLAAFVAACVLGGIWLRHADTAPTTQSEIRAEETSNPLPPPVPAASTEPPAPATVAPAPPPAPVAPAPAKAKSSTQPLPPLPPPEPRAPAPSRTRGHKMKHFELKIFHGRDRRHPRDL